MIELLYAACIQDVRYAGTLFPMDAKEYSSPPLVRVETRSLSDNCESAACGNIALCPDGQFCYDMWRATQCRSLHSMSASSDVVLILLCLHYATESQTGRRHNVCPFVCQQTCDNESTDIDVNWHKWTTMQWNDVFNFLGHEMIKGQGHKRPK